MNKWFDEEKNQNFSKFDRSNDKVLLNNIKNGRVDISGNDIQTTSSFPLYEQSNKGDMIYKNEALKSILTVTDKLSQVYFSSENINLIQQNIKKNIYDKSGHMIQNQSYDNLKIIMRSIYLQYAKHINSNIKAQIKELNKLVYNYCIPNILSNIQLYIGFKKQVSELPQQMARPKYLSNAGLKSIQNTVL